MTALDRLQGDVQRVVAEHQLVMPQRDGMRPAKCSACREVEYPGLWTAHLQHAAHVSERVMAMLAEEWGLVEERRKPQTAGFDEFRYQIPGKTRLVTDFTDDTARESDADNE